MTGTNSYDGVGGITASATSAVGSGVSSAASGAEDAASSAVGGSGAVETAAPVLLGAAGFALAAFL